MKTKRNAAEAPSAVVAELDQPVAAAIGRLIEHAERTGYAKGYHDREDPDRSTMIDRTAAEIYLHMIRDPKAAGELADLARKAYELAAPLCVARGEWLEARRG